MVPLRLRRRLVSNPDVADGSGSAPADATESAPETGEYFPDLWDVLRIRYLLQWKIKVGLPTELVDVIVDAAEYWPSSECHRNEKVVVGTDRDQVLVKTVPLCYEREVRPLFLHYCEFALVMFN